MQFGKHYLFLSVAGVVIPYWQFVPWVREHGVDLPLFFEQLFANRIGAFFGADVFVSAVVVIAFTVAERPGSERVRGCRSLQPFSLEFPRACRFCFTCANIVGMYDAKGILVSEPAF